MYNELLSIKNKFAISVITAFELLNGANNIKQLASTKKEIKAYTILHFDNKISELALQLFSKYSLKRNLHIPDLLIAATALNYNLQLYTDNKKALRLHQRIKVLSDKNLDSKFNPCSTLIKAMKNFYVSCMLLQKNTTKIITPI